MEIDIFLKGKSKVFDIILLIILEVFMFLIICIDYEGDCVILVVLEFCEFCVICLL